MAIRLRKVDGVLTALCAVEVDPKPGDIYLNDTLHQALAIKFARVWRGQLVDWEWPEEDRLAETQKLRDAKEEHMKWDAEQRNNLSKT